jgi:hypothetical protein
MVTAPISDDTMPGSKPPPPSGSGTKSIRKRLVRRALVRCNSARPAGVVRRLKLGNVRPQRLRFL